MLPGLGTIFSFKCISSGDRTRRGTITDLIGRGRVFDSSLSCVFVFWRILCTPTATFLSNGNLTNGVQDFPVIRETLLTNGAMVGPQTNTDVRAIEFLSDLPAKWVLVVGEP